MKQHLLLSVLALSAIANVSADNFIARELDGRLVQFENNANAGSCLNVTDGWITTGPEKTNLSHTAWYAEYDADEDGVVLSHNGKYIGRMPVVAGSAQSDFDGKHIAAVSSKDEAGRYRLYPMAAGDKTVYGLTCTRDADGNLIETIGQMGAWGNTTGWWITDGGTGSGTPVNRWGSGAGTSKWNYSFVDEVEVSVNKTTGWLYQNGTTQTNTAWAKLWKSDKDTSKPMVNIEVAVNNMTYTGDNLVVSTGGGSYDFTITCESPFYYVAKVEFDFAGATASATPTITVDDISLTVSTTSQHLEFERACGETASFHMAGVTGNVITSNFVVTLRRRTSVQVAEHWLETSNLNAYAKHPAIWDAYVVNQAIASLKAVFDSMPTYASAEDMAAIEAACAENINQSKKLINASANGKPVRFRNLLHNSRYISVADRTNGALCAHTTDNADDLHSVWTLVFDEETGAYRLQNYLAARQIGHVTAIETPVPMVAEAEQGHLYDILPIHFKNTSHDEYVVNISDRTGGNRAYLHAGSASTGQVPSGGQRIVKWDAATNDCEASAWFISFVNEFRISVTPETGNMYRSGAATAAEWASKWTSSITGVPAVNITTTANVMRNNDGHVVLATGTGTKDFVITCDDPLYYVAKVEFDFVGASAAVTPTITVKDQSLTVSTETQHLEFECESGETVSIRMAGVNGDVITSNFVITIRRRTSDEIAEHWRATSNFDAYSQHPAIWDAEVVNQSIASLMSEFDSLPMYPTAEQLAEVEVACTASINQSKKLINASADGKTVTFRNLLHSARYMSVADKADGSLCAHTTDNGDDLHAVWVMVFDEETGAYRLQNYLAEREIGHITATENPVPMAAENDEETPHRGHLYDILPIHFKNANHDEYVVIISDRTGGNRAYLHCGGAIAGQVPSGGQRIVKWDAATNDCEASAWFISFKEIVNQMEALKSLEGQDVVISNVDDGTFLSAISGATIGYKASLRPSAIWNIQVNTRSGRLTLKNLLAQTYANDLTSPLSETANSTIKVDDVVSMLDTWHIIPVNTEATDDDAKYSIKAISEEQKEAMIAELNSLYDRNLGNEPGLYHCATEEKYNEYLHMAATIEGINGEAGLDYVAAEAAFNFIENLEFVRFDLNAIEGPALIQMAYTPDGYTFSSLWSGRGFISDQNHAQGLAGTTVNDVATFVLENGRLHSLRTGMGIIDGGASNGPKTYEGEDWAEHETAAIELDFTDVVARNSYYATPYDGIVRYCYAIKKTGTGQTFGGSNTAGGTIKWGTNAGTPGNNFAYTIWYVKELTVDTDGADYRIWRAPVAVSYRESISNVYVISVDGTEITTTELEEGETVYGAGTVFLLTGNTTFDVHNGLNIEVQAAGLGHHSKRIHTMKAGKVYTYIASTEEPAPAAVKRKYVEVPLPRVKMTAIVPEVDTDKVLEPHEALIELDNNPDAPVKHGDTVNLVVGGANTVKIAEISLEETDAPAVYDLMGRRMAAPVKGLNIVNGKKIVVK